MSDLIKRLSEAVSSHIVSVNMLEPELAFLDTILDVVVVYVRSGTGQTSKGRRRLLY
jgi:hypothetical protein